MQVKNVLRWGVALGVIAPAGAQLTIDAGPDLVQDGTLTFQMNGVVTGLQPYDYWMGDGDLTTENQLVCYDDTLGFTNTPSLMEVGSGTLAGWPSDVVEIAGELYGIETGNQYLWKLVDFDLGHVQKIGGNHTWPWVTCLAYDEVGDVLYGVDGNKKRLLRFDYTTGAVTAIGPALSVTQPYWFIKGLAFRQADGLLYAIEDNTETVFTIDPVTAATSYVMDAPSGADLYDELDIHNGELYASYKWWDAAQGWFVATVRHLDLTTGAISNRGPLFDHMSPHTLLIRSFPEELRWVAISGPGTATFADATDPQTNVTFSTTGTYVLELRALADPVVSDQVQVDVLAFDCNGNLVEDADDIQSGASSDLDSNGVPDECELVTYCTAKVNSEGCSPAMFATGTPSVTDPTPFQVGANDELNQRNGLMFYAYQPFVLPSFQGGTLCVQPPLRRLPIQSAGGSLPPTIDCSGQFVLDFNAHAQSGLDPFLTAGAQVNCQWWSRDPNHPDGTGAALSNALQFTLQP